MNVLGKVQAEANAEVYAVASGAIGTDVSCIVNSDGTVSVVDPGATAKGTEVEFNNSDTSVIGSAFDSNSNKVVIFYENDQDSDNLTAIVGTVNPSDNSISFGSPVVVSSGSRPRSASLSCIFDSNSNKVVISWSDQNNSFYGTAIVGTVSSTSISFGTAVVFESANTLAPNITFDSNSNKAVICYRDAGNSSYGTCIVGTVSSTSISFGTAVTFEAASTIVENAVFDPTTNKVCIAYVDSGNSSYGTLAVGSVSGTSISFETPFVFHEGTSNRCPLVKDSNANRVVIPFQGAANDGFAIVIAVGAGTTLTTENYIGISNAAYADTQTATIQAGGAINTGQSSLTIGQQYFVQGDGTLGLSADDPSVIAGTAVSATNIIVKG